jgi:hypothetical protein
VPLGIEALLAGRISLAHLRALADVVLDLDDPLLRRRICEDLLTGPDGDPQTATHRTPAGLKRAARFAAARRDPRAGKRRAAKARKQRGVFLETDNDGMATLIAYLPAEEALALYRTIDAHARRNLPHAPAGPDSAAEPGAAEPGAAEPGAAESGAAESGAAESGAAESGAAESGAAESGAAESGAAESGDGADRACPVDGDLGVGSPEPAVERRSADNARADSFTDLLVGGALLAAGVIPDEDIPDAGAAADDIPDAAAADDTSDAADDETADVGATGQPQAGDSGMPSATRRGRGRMPWPSTTNVQVRVVIAADTLLGLDDQPAELIGYGPITAAHARAMAIRKDATWRRMITDPVSGAVLDVGHRRYRPPASMADLVRADHPTCSFPGCRLPAEACDLDHVVPFDPDDPHGVTSAANLRPGCRRHHILKTLGGWFEETHADGAVTWISPSGHRYRTRRTPFLPSTPCPCPRTPTDHDTTDHDTTDHDAAGAPGISVDRAVVS